MNSFLHCFEQLGSVCLSRPQLRRSWQGILVLGCASMWACLRQVIKNCACLGFEILYMDSSWKNILHVVFFLLLVIPIFGVILLWVKSEWSSDACHMLWTVHARVLKFHIWIPHGNKADPYFFLDWVTPFWSYASKIVEWCLVFNTWVKMYALSSSSMGLLWKG